MTPPPIKPPRADTRDELVLKHPTPVPSRSLTPVQVPISAQEMAATAAGEPPHKESPVDELVRRSRETKNNTINTLTGIETLRRETREDLKEVHAKVDKLASELNTKVDTLGGELKGVQIEVAKTGAQNIEIISKIDELKKDRERSETVKATMLLAETEVGKTKLIAGAEIEKTRQLTDIELEKKQREVAIEDDKERRKIRREFWQAVGTKFLIALGIVSAGVWAYLLAKAKLGAP